MFCKKYELSGILSKFAPLNFEKLKIYYTQWQRKLTTVKKKKI